MEDISWKVVLATSVFLICCPVVVATHVWALWYLEAKDRGRAKAGIHADSGWLIATTLLAIAGMVLIIVGARYGFGKHVADLLHAPPTAHAHDLHTALLLFYFENPLYALTMGMTKIAILCFYLRAFAIHHTFRTLCRALLWSIALYTAASTLVDVFQCYPIVLAWTGTAEEQQEHCVDFVIYWYVRTAVNVVTDVAIALWPIPIVCQLRMSAWKRMKVCCMFLLGFCVVAIALIRSTTIKAAGIRHDPTWNGAMFSVWSVVEVGLGIIIASLPPIPRALALRFPGMCWWLSEGERAKQRKSLSSQDSVAGLVKRPKAGMVDAFAMLREMGEDGWKAGSGER